MKTNHLDRRRKYYFVLDCETATLPFVNEFPQSARKDIAISKPLIYDIGWQIVDNKGKVYRKKSYLITEIFSIPSVFNTAYYANKRPFYLEKIRKGEIEVVSWERASSEMLVDMAEAVAVGAYNSMFDYKKAISFTEEYVTNLYSENYQEWEEKQRRAIQFIVDNPTQRENKEKTNPLIFEFREQSFPLFDVWGLACENLLNNDDYRNFCTKHKLVTASGRYFPTSAESCYRFLNNNENFVEAHTAIEDTEIECEILAKVFEKVKPKEMTMGIIYFPFRIIGRADQWEEAVS